jgi:hypothetical protein
VAGLAITIRPSLIKLDMKNNFSTKASFTKGKSNLSLFICTLAIATLTLGACNNKSKTESDTNNSDPAVHNDTSSAVTPRVDTTPAVHDGVAKQPQ